MCKLADYPAEHYPIFKVAGLKNKCFIANIEDFCDEDGDNRPVLALWDPIDWKCECPASHAILDPSDPDYGMLCEGEDYSMLCDTYEPVKIQDLVFTGKHYKK